MEFNATFIVTIITFIVFVFLMNKILYAPILNIMEERKNVIDRNYKFANENDAKVEELVSEKEEKLAIAKEEAREKYSETMDGYKSEKAEIITESQNSSRDELEASRTELMNLSNEVKDGLKSRMTDLANDIVEKVIGYRSEINGFDNQKIDEILYR